MIKYNMIKISQSVSQSQWVIILDTHQ